MSTIDLSPDKLLEGVNVGAGEGFWRISNSPGAVRKVYLLTDNTRETEGRVLDHITRSLGVIKSFNSSTFNSKPTAFYTRKNENFERNISMENEFHSRMERICDHCGKYGSWRTCICTKRTYCSEECQNHDAKTHSKVCESKTKGKEGESSPCSVCKKQTHRTCSCKTPFCSKECQIEDWKEHRKNCTAKKS